MKGLMQLINLSAYSSTGFWNKVNAQDILQRRDAKVVFMDHCGFEALQWIDIGNVGLGLFSAAAGPPMRIAILHARQLQQYTLQDGGGLASPYSD